MVTYNTICIKCDKRYMVGTSRQDIEIQMCRECASTHKYKMGRGKGRYAPENHEAIDICFKKDLGASSPVKPALKPRPKSLPAITAEKPQVHHANGLTGLRTTLIIL